jgi:carboxymethylenebutenolidase
MLKTPANPGGLPMAVFDGIRAGVSADRSQFFKELTIPFYGANRADSKVSQGLRDCSAAGGYEAKFAVPAVTAAILKPTPRFDKPPGRPRHTRSANLTASPDLGETDIWNRHLEESDMGEYITISTEAGAFGAYLARPAVTPAPSVVVLHEVFGVNADLRMTCDALAAAGFLAVSPDLFWRQSPGVDLSEADWNTALALYAAYDRDAEVTDIAETLKATAHLEGASGKVAVMGYCPVGLMAFLTAARSQVNAVVAFHGGDTEKSLDEAPAITAPMIVHLAADDEFISKAAQSQIKAALADRPNVQIHTYAGCNHAFSRHGGSHDNAEAADLANTRTWSFLKTELT